MRTLKSAFNAIHRKFGKGHSVACTAANLNKQDCYGMAYQTEDGSWCILIHDDLPLGMQIHFLVHEYAHTLVPQYGRYQHGAMWGVIHAAIYSYVFDGVSVARKRRKRKTRVGGT